LQYITLILTFLFFASIIFSAIWWFWHCRKEPDYNGLLFVHPDKGGGIIGIKKDPGIVRPYYFNYHKLEFGIPYFRKPLYLWSQDKIVDDNGEALSYPIRGWEPTVPADFMLQSTAKGEPDKSRPYVTPNQLFNTTDWSPLKKLETSPHKLAETIKLSVAVLLAAICLAGIIMTLDMIGQKDPAQPVQTGKPNALIIQPINYEGLLI
jgi:hypothetical protein